VTCTPFVPWPDFQAAFSFRPADPDDPTNPSKVRNLLVDIGVEGSFPPVASASNRLGGSSPIVSGGNPSFQPYSWVAEAGGFDAGGNAFIVTSPFLLGQATGFPNKNPCPGASAGPLCGFPGIATVLWMRFDLARRTSILESPFFNLAWVPGAGASPTPTFAGVLTSPPASTFPPGAVAIEFRGSVTGPPSGAPCASDEPADATAWTTNLSALDGYPYLQVRITLAADLATGVTPYIDDLRIVFVSDV
jgi:hypothetical protein